MPVKGDDHSLRLSNSLSCQCERVFLVNDLAIQRRRVVLQRYATYDPLARGVWGSLVRAEFVDVARDADLLEAGVSIGIFPSRSAGHHNVLL